MNNFVWHIITLLLVVVVVVVVLNVILFSSAQAVCYYCQWYSCTPIVLLLKLLPVRVQEHQVSLWPVLDSA